MLIFCTAALLHNLGRTYFDQTHRTFLLVKSRPHLNRHRDVASEKPLPATDLLVKNVILFMDKGL